MAKRNYVAITTRKRGTENLLKLDINECRAAGRKTKRLLKSGMPLREAKTHNNVSKGVF